MSTQIVIETEIVGSIVELEAKIDLERTTDGIMVTHFSCLHMLM